MAKEPVCENIHSGKRMHIGRHSNVNVKNLRPFRHAHGRERGGSVQRHKNRRSVSSRVVSLIQVNMLRRDPGYFTFLSDGFTFQTGTGTRGVFHPKTNSSQPPPRPIERNRPPKAKRAWLASPSPRDIKARPLSPYRHSHLLLIRFLFISVAPRPAPHAALTPHAGSPGG